MLRIVTAALVLLAALGLGGCLGGEERSTRIKGDTVVIYSSLPRSGISAGAAAAVAAGERLALQDAGWRAGALELELVELDSTEPEARLWDPGRVSANADRAADDDRAIAYLGELDYGASAVSVPITNDAGLLQVSPLDGLTSLTRAPLGRPRAGPDRYYPTGERSFVRLVPPDELLAEKLIRELRDSGAERMAVIWDNDIHSRELGGVLTQLGRRDGPEPVVAVEYRGAVDEIPDIVNGIARERPDVVVYAGIAGPGTGRILAAIEHMLPGVPVHATYGLLARDPEVPFPVAPAVVTATGPIPPADRLPHEAQRLLERIRDADGAAAARPEAVWGYEAMRLVIDAVEAGGADRARVAAEALRIRERQSALGPYRVLGTGEVDTSTFAQYDLRDGVFVFERMVE